MSGEAGSLASTLGAAQDRGRWWIDNDHLCVKWFRWFEAQTRCLTVQHEGTKLYWRDQSGESGTATITRTDPQPVADDPPRITPIATTSTTPPPSSEAVVAPTPTLETPNEDAQPLRRFAAVDLSASILVGDSSEPSPSKLGVGTSDAPAVPLPKVTKVGPNSPVQIATRSEPTPSLAPSFRVTGVAKDDALIIRSGPSEFHPSVGSIPPGGKGVQIVGTCHELWCPIRHQHSAGWVNRYYLADENTSPRTGEGP